MKTEIIPPIAFPLTDKPYFSTLLIEIPQISDEDGRLLVADMVKKFPDQMIKFEVKNAKKES